MSEKRYYYNIFDDGTEYIEDYWENKHYFNLDDVEELLNEQQSNIERLEQRDYYNQSERYKILGRAIELASDYIHTNNLEYYDFCGLVTEFEEELLEDKEMVMSEKYRLIKHNKNLAEIENDRCDGV